MKKKMLKVAGIIGIGLIAVFMIFQLYKYWVKKPEIEKLTVVCTTSILASHVEEIGKDLIEVVSIVPAGMCPAHYDVKPSDISTMSKASLLVSQGIEPWLNGLIKASGNKNLKRISIEGSTIPFKVIEEIKIIKDALLEVDSENASRYEENTQELINLIKETAEKIKKKAKELQVEKYKVICIKWQEYFTKWIGFKVAATYFPPERISWKEIFKLIHIGKEENVALVVDNLQSGIDFGEKLASEIGAVQVVSINFPGSVPGTETYIKMMEYKADKLFKGLEEYNTAEKKARSLL